MNEQNKCYRSKPLGFGGVCHTGIYILNTPHHQSLDTELWFDTFFLNQKVEIWDSRCALRWQSGMGSQKVLNSVLRPLCENNTEDALSEPFGSWRKKEELKWTRRKRKVWQAIPDTSIQMVRDYHPFPLLVVLPQSQISNKVFTDVQRNRKLYFS